LRLQSYDLTALYKSIIIIIIIIITTITTTTTTILTPTVTWQIFFWRYKCFKLIMFYETR